MSNEAVVVVWLRPIDRGTDNECWVVCNRVDPGAVRFVSTADMCDEGDHPAGSNPDKCFACFAYQQHDDG